MSCGVVFTPGPPLRVGWGVFRIRALTWAVVGSRVPMLTLVQLRVRGVTYHLKHCVYLLSPKEGHQTFNRWRDSNTCDAHIPWGS